MLSDTMSPEQKKLLCASLPTCRAALELLSFFSKKLFVRIAASIVLSVIDRIEKDFCSNASGTAQNGVNK